MLWYNFMKKKLSLHIFIIVKKKKKIPVLLHLQHFADTFVQSYLQ